MRSDGHKWKCRKSCLNTTPHFFYREGGQAEEQVARDTVETSIAEDIQNVIGHGPSPSGL